MALALLAASNEEIKTRTEVLLREHCEVRYATTDRLFAVLMGLQWVAAIAAAYWVAPRAWEGMSSGIHPHVLGALLLGGTISLFPIALAIWFPGRPLTRHVIAVGQLMMSGLLIHLCGGRIETHFHVFGSLAFLAFYRDWRVLLTASLVTAADHALRGVVWPQSMYGVAMVEPLRWVEHTGWVLFEDTFLVISILQSQREVRRIAWRQASQEFAETALQQAHEQLELRVQRRTAQLAEANAALEADIAERLAAEQKVMELHALLESRLGKIVVLNSQLEHAYDSTIQGWSRALELRDRETEGHSQRVTEMSVALAEAIGLSAQEIVDIRRGALLHDIGKMGVPDAILLKPGPLTEAEWAVMRQHPTYACSMLSEVEFLQTALEIPLCHHEKWDGTGYPRGLKGEAIPLSARLFAVIDVWDALRSNRPYRQGWSIVKTREHIASSAGSHFDPRVVDAFLSCVAPAAETSETIEASVSELRYAA